MALASGQGDLQIQLQVPQTLPSADRTSLLSAFGAKILAMDPTNVRATWTFGVSRTGPSVQDAVTQANTFVSALAGDESVIAAAAPQPSDFIYCVFGNISICYQQIALFRTQSSPDTLWGGAIGPNSRIAWQQNGQVVPMNVVYRFATQL